MSSIARDMVEGYGDIAREISNFLWEGRPLQSNRKVKTVEELENFLESIRKECWSNYDTGARSLGWK